MTTTYSNLASRLLLRTIFHLPNISTFRIAELEIYPSDDPYTHGYPSQVLVGPNHFYFHRASIKTDSKFRGGTFKGLDLTFSYKGHKGGVLIRSIAIGVKDGPVIEGPCNVVNWLLEQAGVETISEFIEKVLGGDLDVSEYLIEDKNLPDGRLAVIRGPRFGLSYPMVDAKRETFYLPLRFMTSGVLPRVKKGKFFMAVSPSNSKVDFSMLRSYQEWTKYFEIDYSRLREVAPKGTEQSLSAYGTYVRYGWGSA